MQVAANISTLHYLETLWTMCNRPQQLMAINNNTIVHSILFFDYPKYGTFLETWYDCSIFFFFLMSQLQEVSVKRKIKVFTPEKIVPRKKNKEAINFGISV